MGRSMSDQVRAWERPEGEMALERYRLPMLIGQGGMGKVIAVAAAAIALAPFSVLAATPGVAQAAMGRHWGQTPACRNCLLPAAQRLRISRHACATKPRPARPGARAGAGADSGAPPGARAYDHDADADPTGRSAKSPAHEDHSGGGRSRGAHPTLVALGTALRGTGDSGVLCRLDDPSFENVERALMASAPWPARRGFAGVGSLVC